MEGKAKIKKLMVKGKLNDQSGVHMRCGSVKRSIFEMLAIWLYIQISYLTT
jgi:hypothetical protein